MTEYSTGRWQNIGRGYDRIFAIDITFDWRTAEDRSEEYQNIGQEDDRIFDKG
jgi:hypothetical protein